MVTLSYPAALAGGAAFPGELLPTLLAVSLTAVCVLRPLYGPDGVAPLDFALDYLNPAGQRMLELPEQPASTVLARFPDTVRNGALAFYCQVFASGKAGRYDFNYQADGLDNYFHVAAQRHGQRLVVSFTDTADHKRSAVEKALRASQAREQQSRLAAEARHNELYQLFEQAPVAIAVFRGPRYVVEWANPAVCAMWGRTHEQAVGLPLFELLPEAASQGFEELLDAVLATGIEHVAKELPSFIDRQNHRTKVYWNFVYQPLREAKEKITGITVVAMDVTEQVLARQQIQSLNEELATAVEKLRTNNAELEQTVADRTQALLVTLGQLEKRGQELTHALAAEQELGELKSRFVSMASHEFRTPLTTVLTSADLILDYPDGGQQPQRLKHVQRIRASVKYLNTILEEFLSVGRIDQGRVAAHPAPLDLAALLRETVADVETLLKTGQTIDWQAQCLLPMLLDPSLLRKILVNLLSNALKYSGAGTVVTVRASCQNQVLTLSVADQGVGISADDQVHLFEQFFRAHNVATTPGTGLGLYIIARYLELMGGTIALHSELGKGTIVTISVPYENNIID